MVNRYLLACILSTCYFSSEVAASNAAAKRAKLEALSRQKAAAAVAPVANPDKPLADEGRALQRVNTLFGADPNATAPNILSGGIQGQITEVRNLNGLNSLFGADPNTTAPNILSGGIQGQITQVRALHGVGDLVGVANFNAEPYLTTLDGAARTQLGHVHDFNQVQDFVSVADFEQEPYQTALHANARAQLGHVHDFNQVQDFVGEDNFEQEPYQTALHANARAQLGRVHALHEVDDLATVGDNALNDGEDNEFTTVLDNGLRHQMKGLQMVLKPSSIPDNLYDGFAGTGGNMEAGFGIALRNFLSIPSVQAITNDTNNARRYVNELRNAIKITATPNAANAGNYSDWQLAIAAIYNNANLDNYLKIIHGMANDINNGDAFDRPYLLFPIKELIRDMLIHFPVNP